MSDEGKRRAYDFLYLAWKTAPTAYFCPPPTIAHHEAKIAKHQALKHRRQTQWQAVRQAYISRVLELQSDIRQLQQEIQLLSYIEHIGTVKNENHESLSNDIWLPDLTTKSEHTKNDKLRKVAPNQEKRAQRDDKEKRVEALSKELDRERNHFELAKSAHDDATKHNNEQIRYHKAMICDIENQARRQTERPARADFDSGRAEEETAASRRQEKQRQARRAQDSKSKGARVNKRYTKPDQQQQHDDTEPLCLSQEYHPRKGSQKYRTPYHAT